MTTTEAKAELKFEHRKKLVPGGWNNDEKVAEIQRVVVSPKEGLSDKPVVVATVHCGGPIHHSVADRYGKLFAASEDLLEACQRIVGRVDKSRRIRIGDIAACRDAVAKAVGN